MKFILIFLLLLIINPFFVFSKSSFIPFRVFIGGKQQVLDFRTSLTLEERNFNQITLSENSYYKRTEPADRSDSICVKKEQANQDIWFTITGSQGGEFRTGCRKKNDQPYGYSNDIGSINPTIFLETFPTYIYWRFGINAYLMNANASTTFVDYPTINEEYDFKYSAITLGLPIFITAGDKNLGEGGNFSFRIGYGPNISHIDQFEISNNDNKYNHNGWISGEAFFMEFTYLNITFKVLNSDVDVNVSDSFIKNNVVTVNNNNRYLGYYYEF